MSKLKSQRSGLSKKSTTELLTKLKENSGGTWIKIESLLKMGTDNSTQLDGGNANGGSEPGKIIEMYRSGKRHLLPHKALNAIELGHEMNWITSHEYHRFSQELFENRFSKEYIDLERKILKSMENQGRRILKTMMEHPDLDKKQLWDAIDMVLSPMLKRLFVEECEQKKYAPDESFFPLILADSVINRDTQKKISPEEKFADFLESI